VVIAEVNPVVNLTNRRLYVGLLRCSLRCNLALVFYVIFWLIGYLSVPEPVRKVVVVVMVLIAIVWILTTFCRGTPDLVQSVNE